MGTPTNPLENGAFVVGRYEMNGETYSGQIRGGKSEGHGVYHWSGGSKYCGQFRDGT